MSKPGDYLKNPEGYIRRATKSYSGTFLSVSARLHRMVVEAKSRAKSKNIEFDITSQDIKWNDICPVLGIPIMFQRNKGKGGDDFSPSIDRIDNTKGYTRDNVRLISNRANKLKNQMTKLECALILETWNKV